LSGIKSRWHAPRALGAIANRHPLALRLWEAVPAHAFHHGAFEFRDDGEASRSLFDAVAVMTGLMSLVRELEARLAADVEFKGTDA
jgi:hypothetical protein